MTDKYQFTEDGFLLSRRRFMTVGAAILALLALPVGWLGNRIAKRNEYIKARADASIWMMPLPSTVSAMPTRPLPAITANLAVSRWGICRTSCCTPILSIALN